MEALESAGVDFRESVGFFLEEATLSVNAPKTYSGKFQMFELFPSCHVLKSVIL